MRSFLTVIIPAETTALVSLDRVLLELGITTSASDDLLTAKIAEASSAIEAYLGRRLGLETLRERFRFSHHDTCIGGLYLSRTPVYAIASVDADGTLLGPSPEEYLIDDRNGELVRADDAPWDRSDEVTVEYTGGYLLPDMDDPGAAERLPAAIEQAAIEMIRTSWSMHLSDPTIRSESIAGVISIDYGFGGFTAGQLPPAVTALLEPFRVPVIA